MKTETLKNPSLAELYGYIESTSAGYLNIFRGQPDAEYNLTPGLYRNKPPYSYEGPIKWQRGYELYETDMVNEFLNRAIPYLPPYKRSLVNDLIICQHYGVPTLLLDWSNDPLVGLFFAIQGFAPDKLDRYKNLTNENDKRAEKDGAFYIARVDGFANNRTDGLYADDSMEIMALNPPVVDQRVAAQRSVFTFQKYMEENGEYVPMDKRILKVKNCLTKIIIPSDLKIELYKILTQIGIDRSFLFPGLDGIGQTIKLKSYGQALFV